MKASELRVLLDLSIRNNGDSDVTLRFEDSSFETTDLDIVDITFDRLQGEFPIQGPQLILVAGCVERNDAAEFEDRVRRELTQAATALPATTRADLDDAEPS